MGKKDTIYDYWGSHEHSTTSLNCSCVAVEDIDLLFHMCFTQAIMFTSLLLHIYFQHQERVYKTV